MEVDKLVILVSAQVLLVLTLGLWTSDLGLTIWMDSLSFIVYFCSSVYNNKTDMVIRPGSPDVTWFHDLKQDSSGNLDK